jgi:hypothetical protein
MKRKGSGTEASWGDVARGACRIAVDTPWVVGPRLLRLAGGGEAARDELALMVAEKWFAHAAYAKAVAKGTMGRSLRDIAAGTLGYYGLWIRHNRRRLAAGE